MSEFALEGPELKEMVKLARKGALPFAFNPGKSPDEHYFALHRKRPAKVLAKAAKEEGVGKKAAFGTCVIEGKVMRLQCEVVVPTMAKTIKKFLKANKITLNVEILDADGVVLESDIEDLPDDPEFDDDGTPDETQPDLSAASLIARVKAAQPLIAAAAKPIAEKLAPALKKVVGEIKAENLAAADTSLGLIEGVLAKLSAASEAPAAETAATPSTAELAKRLAGIKAGIKAGISEIDGPMAEKLNAGLAKVVGVLKAGNLDAAAAGATQLGAALAKTQSAAPPPPAPPPSDPQLIKLTQLTQNFESQAGVLENKETAAGILKALAPASWHIRDGDKPAAATLLTQVRALLEAAKLAQAEAKQARDEIPDTPEGFRAPSGPEYDAWIAAFNRVEPQVNRAMSEGLVEDVSTLRRDWSGILSKAEAGGYSGALADLAVIQQMLDAGRSDGGTSHLADVPDDVRPFAISRIKWNDTRTTMMSEVTRLENMIKDVVGDDEDFEMTERLTTKIATLDTRLGDALDDIVNAPEGDDRDTAKSAATDILGQYQSALDDPFFADVDNNSGFGSVVVMSTAKKALGEIAKVLVCPLSNLQRPPGACNRPPTRRQ